MESKKFLVYIHNNQDIMKLEEHNKFLLLTDNAYRDRIFSNYWDAYAFQLKERKRKANEENK